MTAPIGRPHLGEAPTAAWYRFSPDRKGARPREHLANYTGFMHADGYAGFEELYRSGRVHEVTCTLALSVPNAEVGLRLGIALFGSAAIPLHCLGIVLRHALADGVHDAEVVLRGGMALLGGAAIPFHGLRSDPVKAQQIADAMRAGAAGVPTSFKTLSEAQRRKGFC